MRDYQENLKYLDIPYIRVIKDSPSAPRGTVYLNECVIPEYPSIKRAYILKKAIEREFGSEKFITEEKVDGTNIRMVYDENKEQILAFSRGGYICPYSTEIAQNNKELQELFQDFPNLIVCGELIGQNPYNHISIIYGEKPRIKVFDIFLLRKDLQQDLLLPLQRQELLERYSIETVKVFGKDFTKENYKDIVSIIEELENQEREGIVLKALDGLEPRIKYITFSACSMAIADHIVKGFEQFAPITRERFYLAACYLSEMQNLTKEESIKILGTTIIDRMQEIVKNEEVSESYLVTISEEGWQELNKRMSKQITVRVDEKEKLSENFYQIKFRKIYAKSTGRLKEYLKGRTYID